MMKYIIIFLVSLCACQQKGPANQKSTLTDPVILPNTEIRYVKSSMNGVDYKLYVSLPHDYDTTGNTQYSVLYTLDADYSFAIAKNISDHLYERDHLKGLIIVGIAYGGEPNYRLNRTRDYTPTKTIEAVSFREIQENNSGGAPAFKSFIKEELIPFIDQNYFTCGENAISGHSYGGLFCTWIFLTEPSLFDGYIIVSPSLWYDNHYLFELLEKYSSGENNRISFQVGSREVNQNWNMPEDLTRFVEKLNSKNLENLDIQFKVCEDETHNSIFPRAVSDGIRFVFNGV